MPGLSSTTGSNPVGNNPSENPGVGNRGGDPLQPVANTEQYESSGPNMYIAEKKKLLSFATYPYREPAPLQEALWVRGAPEPKKFLETNYTEQRITQDNESLSWLIKVRDYFYAIDAGKNPTYEQEKAYNERVVRYKSFLSSDNWKGPKIDYDNPSNVRKEALQDLVQIELNVARNEMIVNAFAKEKFSEGIAYKTDFYKRLNDVSGEHYKKCEHGFKMEYEKDKAWYDTLDRKTLLYILEYKINYRKEFFNTHIKGWLEEESNRDLFKKWSKDKIHQDFIEEWLKDNESIKNLK